MKITTNKPIKTNNCPSGVCKKFSSIHSIKYKNMINSSVALSDILILLLVGRQLNPEGRALFCGDGGGHPSTGNPISLSGKPLFSLIGVGEGTPIGHRHDFTRTELIPIRSDEKSLLEGPTCPIRINDPDIPGREKLDKLSRRVRRIFTTFPSTSSRDVNLTDLRNPFSLKAIKSRMLVYGAKCSHGRKRYAESIDIATDPALPYAYNVYYFNDLAQQTSNLFKTFLHLSRTILPRAFCCGVF